MITNIGVVGIPVANYDKALDFYVNKLGFEKRADVPMEEDARWVEVAPAGSQTRFVLEKTQGGNLARKGTFLGYVLETEDLDATFAELKGRGVRFTLEPKKEYWGYWSQFVDQDENEFGLIERGS
jgi:catechol 2,3-dioxygenase-like lactoylglutathione lyase family enzyme